MSIKVKISSSFARYTDNRLTAKVKGSNIGECLNDLIEQFPYLKQAFFDSEGKLQRHIHIFVNGERAYPETLAKSIADNDNIFIAMLIAGG